MLMRHSRPTAAMDSSFIVATPSDHNAASLRLAIMGRSTPNQVAAIRLLLVWIIGIRHHSVRLRKVSPNILQHTDK
jgi:hypothetical protein